MSKILMFTGSGTIIPDAGVNTVTVVMSLPRGLVIEGLSGKDTLSLLRQNYAGDGWEFVTNGNSIVQFSSQKTYEPLTIPGVYGLSGTVEGTVTAYSVDSI